MCIVTELSVPADAFVLREALAAAPDATVRLDHRVAAPGPETLRFRAAGDDVAAFEAALDADETVTNVVALTDGGTGDARRFRASPTGAVGPLFGYADEGTVVEHARGTDGRWTLDVRFDDRERLGRFQAFCRERAVTFTVRRVADDHQESTRRRYGLTSTQAETLRLALREGYFRVPQETTLSELATHFDVSQQALSARLHRAQQNLLSAVLADEASARVDIDSAGRPPS